MGVPPLARAARVRVWRARAGAAVVFWVSGWFNVAVDQRLVLASLCVASSPAAIMRVTHELRSSGQVTERLLHLCALNCLFAVLLLKGVVGSGTWRPAVTSARRRSTACT